MPIPINSFEEILRRNDVFFLPSIIELGPDNLQVVLKQELLLFIFEQQPHEHKFLIEVLSRFKYLNSGALLGFEIFHIEYIGHKGIRHLPGRVHLNEIRNVIIDR